MSCKNPNGMIVVNNLDKYEVAQIKSRKFKINNDNNKAYKFLKLPDYYEKHVTDIINSVVPDNLIKKSEFLQIPCGQCLACRLDYSKNWATRCYGESLYHDNNYFITLTYDDDHVPYGSINNYTLKKEDFQKFIKALRNYGFKDLRYFGCGEYGDDTHRPHYHVILYNCFLPDLTQEIPYSNNGKIQKISKTDKDGDPFYYSEIIKNAWHGNGNIIIGRCTYHSCAYVARYVCKKAKGINKNIYDSLGIEPEFVLMSRRPGIGQQFIIDNYDKFKDNPAIFIPSESPFLSSFGKYFTKIQKKINLQDYENRKEDVKKFADKKLLYRSSINSRSLNSQNKDELEQLELKTKILKRSNIDTY